MIMRAMLLSVTMSAIAVAASDSVAFRNRLGSDLVRNCTRAIETAAEDTLEEMKKAADAGVREIRGLVGQGEHERAHTIADDVVQNLKIIAEEGIRRIEGLADECVAQLRRFPHSDKLIAFVRRVAKENIGPESSALTNDDSIRGTLAREIQRVGDSLIP